VSVWVLVVWLGGCEAPAGETPAEDLGDCAAGDGPATAISAELTGVETVVRVTWETPGGADSRVVFETDTGERRTPLSSGETHTALLVGNRAHTDVRWRVESTDASGTACGDWHTTPTGALPTGLPAAHLSEGTADDGPGWVVAPIYTEDDAWVAILDAGGEYVWAWRSDGEKATSFFGAELADDGTGVLVNVSAQSEATPGPIYRIGFDGVLGEPLLVNGAHTDFVQLPDGRVGVLAWEVRTYGTRRLLGDTVVELDTTGATRTVWSVFDWFEPDLSQTYEQGWYPGDPTVEDWSHVNGLAYDAATDAWLLTLSFNQSVAHVDRATGDMTWLLADDAGDYTMTESLVRYPHSVQAVDGGVLLFNRGDIYDPNACSEATQITLDGDTATRAWTWTSERCLLVPFLGSAARLPDGRTAVDWTTAGQLDVVGADEALQWRLSLDLGGAFGFTDVVPALEPPRSR
jgi:hypothetical protein